MSARLFLAVALSLTLSFAPAAVADPRPDATPAQVAHLSTAREMLHAMFIESDILSDMSLQISREATPTLLARTRATPFFSSLSPNAQQAVISYYSNDLPQIAQEEAVRNGPLLIDTFAPRFAAVFAETELQDLTALMHTEHGPSAVLKLILGRDPSELTSEELAAFDAFFETPGGRAFGERSEQVEPLMRELGAATTSPSTFGQRIRRDLCGRLGAECPAEWRTP